MYGEFVIVSSLAHGVFAYHLDVTGALYLVSHITQFDNMAHTLYPVSLAVDRKYGLLYILEQTDSIYVYKIIAGQLVPYDIIAFKHA